MIKEKLNLEFEEGQQSESCFEFRAVSENAYNVISETILRLEEIKASARFDLIDQEIKAEAQAILNIFKTAKTALDSHSDFLSWRQPE
ncbi:MAG: hypothetical protein ACFFDN_42670 [Candidatus Hodarchaeota archaeon]